MNGNKNKKIESAIRALAQKRGYRSLREMQEALLYMKTMTGKELAGAGLKELNEIQIDQTLPVEERILALLYQTENPYFYRYEDTIVRASEEECDLLDNFIAIYLGEGGDCDDR